MKTAFPTIVDISALDHLRSASVQSDADHLTDDPFSFSVLFESKTDDCYSCCLMCHSFVLFGFCGDVKLGFFLLIEGAIHLKHIHDAL